MSTYATFFLGRAQKFEVNTKTDDARDEIKIEIKTGFDNITIGITKAQTQELANKLALELGDTNRAAGPKDDVPF